MCAEPKDKYSTETKRIQLHGLTRAQFWRYFELIVASIFLNDELMQVSHRMKIMEICQISDTKAPGCSPIMDTG